MAADPNKNFYTGMPSSSHGPQVVSFQSGVVSPVISPIDGSRGVSNGPGMELVGSSSRMSMGSSMSRIGSFPGNLLFDQTTELKDDAGLATDWSYNEQLLLDAGLIRYADEPNMRRYIKIAASLPGKTVRDVALRCQWMTKKEKASWLKPEDYYTGNKVKDIKDTVVGSSFLPNMSVYPPTDMASCSSSVPDMDLTDQFSYEVVPIIDDVTQSYIEENALLSLQIEDNLKAFKLQDNISLLRKLRSNITSILSRMRQMPGIMSQMHPLPIEMNETLADGILPGIDQPMMYDVPGGYS